VRCAIRRGAVSFASSMDTLREAVQRLRDLLVTRR
jgi:hypothetical protein